MQTVETFFCLLTFVASLATDPGVLAAPNGVEQPVFNETLPGSKSTTIAVRSFNLSVGALNNSLDFTMFGCGGLKLSLLRSIPANVADAADGVGNGGVDGGGGEPFVQVYIGIQRTISIRKCRDPSSSGVRETRGGGGGGGGRGGEVSCEDLFAENVNVVYCYDQSNFRLRWNESTIEVLGGFNNKQCDKTLIIYTLPPPPPPPPPPTLSPPPSSPSSPIPSSMTEFSDVKEGEKASEDLSIQTMLTGIHTIRVENGDHSLQFTIFRRTDKNFCFVGEKEESRVAQCGDDFISKQRCIDCGCCYDDYRQPSCYQSLVVTVNNSRHFDTRYQFLTRRHDAVGGEERVGIN